MPDQEHTRPSSETRAEEERDAKVKAGADRTDGSTSETDDAKVDDDVAEHYEEMIELGADQKGEGRLP